MSDKNFRGLKPLAELAARKPHGVRIKYQAGCRCRLCTDAVAQYQRERRVAQKNGDWNGLVRAGPARKHILQLNRSGIGVKSIAATANVSRNVILRVKKGTKTQIRHRTERRIRAVTKKDAMGDGTLIKAKRTWVKINRLLREGFTRRALAERMGFGHALQINKYRITARTAMRVEKFYRKIMEE